MNIPYDCFLKMNSWEQNFQPKCLRISEPLTHKDEEPPGPLCPPHDMWQPGLCASVPKLCIISFPQIYANKAVE